MASLVSLTVGTKIVVNGFVVEILYKRVVGDVTLIYGQATNDEMVTDKMVLYDAKSQLYREMEFDRTMSDTDYIENMESARIVGWPRKVALYKAEDRLVGSSRTTTTQGIYDTRMPVRNLLAHLATLQDPTDAIRELIIKPVHHIRQRCSTKLDVDWVLEVLKRNNVHSIENTMSMRVMHVPEIDKTIVWLGEIHTHTMACHQFGDYGHKVPDVVEMLMKSANATCGSTGAAYCMTETMEFFGGDGDYEHTNQDVYDPAVGTTYGRARQIDPLGVEAFDIRDELASTGLRNVMFYKQADEYDYTRERRALLNRLPLILQSSFYRYNAQATPKKLMNNFEQELARMREEARNIPDEELEAYLAYALVFMMDIHALLIIHARPCKLFIVHAGDYHCGQEFSMMRVHYPKSAYSVHETAELAYRIIGTYLEVNHPDFVDQWNDTQRLDDKTLDDFVGQQLSSIDISCLPLTYKTDSFVTRTFHELNNGATPVDALLNVMTEEGREDQQLRVKEGQAR